MPRYTYKTQTIQVSQNIKPSVFFGGKIGAIKILNRTGGEIQVNQLPIINGRLEDFPNYGGGFFEGELDIKIRAGGNGLVYITAQLFV